MSKSKELKGLGGWLILVGIGVVVTPIRLLVTFVPLYSTIFKDGTWEALTTVGSDAYHPLWAPLLIGEITYNVMMLLASIYLIYLFFSKHYLFPVFFIGIIGVSVVFVPLDAWFASRLFPGEPMFDADTGKEFIRTLIGALIWVPYMLVSKRVKATFVEKSPEGQVQLPAEQAITEDSNTTP